MSAVVVVQDPSVSLAAFDALKVLVLRVEELCGLFHAAVPPSSPYSVHVLAPVSALVSTVPASAVKAAAESASAPSFADNLVAVILQSLSQFATKQIQAINSNPKDKITPTRAQVRRGPSCEARYRFRAHFAWALTGYAFR